MVQGPPQCEPRETDENFRPPHRHRPQESPLSVAPHPEFGRCTMSIGMAEAPRHGTTVDALLAAADSGLYKAKRGGRDAVELADD